MLCARATRAITNHALIGEYHLHFFPKKEFQLSIWSLSYWNETAHSLWVQKVQQVLESIKGFNCLLYPVLRKKSESICVFISFYLVRSFLYLFSIFPLFFSLVFWAVSILFFFFLCFFTPLFLVPCCISHHVCSYEVTTMVCHHALCNKLLIFFKKKSRLFFCEKILISLIIMLECHSWLSESIVFWFLKVLSIS